MYDIIIVGAGPAGLTAAIYALRAGKTALVIEKNGFGGQIAYSPKVENIPGIASISGAQFADDLTSQAMALGAEMELECVVEVVPTDSGFEIKTEEGSTFAGRSVILATGVKHRTLGLPGEEMLIGSGLSFCAVCDGAFYAGGKVVMVGGGNSALQEALLLSDICAHVTVVQNLPYFTGEKKLADALMQKENVTVLFDSLVTGYLVNEGALSGVTVQRGEDTQNIMVDGAFLAVGLVPENDAFAHLAGLNTHGYFDSGEDCMTATPGLFVAGDCRSKNIRQVVTAAADGAAAATAACRYIDSL